MSLAPGTRIPLLEDLEAPVVMLLLDQRDRPTFYRGLVEGGVLGIIMGSLVTACCLALAWSHWGG